MIWHVTPINDKKEHTQYTDEMIAGKLMCLCECNPLHEYFDNGRLVVIHNSFDGREGVEWANEILDRKEKKTDADDL